MNFTNIQQQVIDGCLLGDGFLEKGKGNRNACFRYTSSCKAHTEYVHSFLKDFCTEQYQQIKRTETFDKRTNKTYVSYRFKTKSLSIFTDLYTKWYTPKKIVPRDLKISKYLLLLWFIGDGTSDGRVIKLCTDGFNKEDVLFLCSLLTEYEASLIKHSNNFRVYIPRRQIEEFLNFIGGSPFIEYSHKWYVKPYKNLNIEKNGFTYYSLEDFQKIEEELKITNKSIYQLSKEFKVPLGSIKNYLKNNNIVWKRKELKKSILQYDLLGNFIKEWKSGQEICNNLKYNASAISECCRNIRNQYKGFIWKFKANS
jgi:hypothetical protein